MLNFAFGFGQASSQQALQQDAIFFVLGLGNIVHY